MILVNWGGSIEDQPPGNLGIITRIILAFSVVFKRTGRLLAMDTLRYIRNPGIPRCRINLQDI